MPTMIPQTSPKPQSGEFRLTGRHVLIMLMCFFGVMLAANITMATLAIKTFRGEVAANPYQAGLKFNTEIAEARAQAERNWRVAGRTHHAADGATTVTFTARDASNAPIAGLEMSVVLESPTDRKRDRVLTVRETAPGDYLAEGSADAGAWMLELVAKRDGVRMFKSRNRVALN